MHVRHRPLALRARLVVSRNGVVMTDQRLTVDPIACHAHGLCAELLPELVDLDEWGYPIVRGDAVPPRLLADGRGAVTACPTLALRLRASR